MRRKSTSDGVSAVTSPTPASPEPESESLVRSGLRERVTHRILTFIFEGKFKAGERIVVERLSNLFGVSPTPVRESLIELAGIGMVDLLPNRGAVVRPFGKVQLKEMVHVRQVLESEAARCTAQRANSDDFKALQNELLELNKLPPGPDRDHRAQLADTRLHSLLADQC